MEIRKIQNLMKQNNLGNSIINITKVTGGLSHRMYKVITEKGIYAVKELNQGIMKRKEAYSNFIFSEKVSNFANKNGIPSIHAIKLKENIIQKIEDDYFMVFHWLEGKTLKPEEITKQHCEIMGKILAEIHNIDFSEIEVKKEKKTSMEVFNWKQYLTLAKERNKSYVVILEQNLELLYQFAEKSNEAVKYANQNLVISHRDLDRKNVIWQGINPFIIDWEASDYINPMVELIQVAWYWSGGDAQKIDYQKFETLVKVYQKYAKRKFDNNIRKLIYADIYDGLEWIKYNLERSLCIGNFYEQDEIELAENEIRQSIQEIKYNVSQMDKMLEILEKE